jgi:MoaA/NifB/PqqE/SkfB family radical SAM enzyme
MYELPAAPTVQEEKMEDKPDQTIILNPEVINGMVLDGDKLAWHKERIEAWKRGEKIAPITIDMALTRACNARCTFCYAMLQDNEVEELNVDTVRQTKEVIDNFLDDAAEIGVKGISFISDGESTVHPYVYDAILRGKKNGIDMALGTNGFLLKDDKMEEMLPALSYLRFNISAGEPKRFEEIMGMPEKHFHVVVSKIKKAMEIKKKNNLDVTIGMQMVFMPQFKDQLLPLAKLGKELGVDYLVIKHCSDDEMGSLGVNYRQYEATVPEIKKAENISDDNYKVVPKWSKLLSEGKREYKRCYGPPFILQMSGSGLVAPCGMLFNERYKDLHIGDITKTRFKDIWNSDRYWQVMRHLSSVNFDAQKMCGALCLQHKVNERLYHLVENGVPIPEMKGGEPLHVNFI